jgi:heptosyltransferase-2
VANKILVIRLSSLGDVILTAPVYKNLKAHWPQSRICVLVKPAFAGIVSGMPGVDEVIPFSGLRDAVRRIEAGGFSHLLDLHANLRSWLLRRLTRVPNVSVYRKDALARRLFVAFGLPSPALERHNAERYLAALRPWGVPIRERWLALADLGERPAASLAQDILPRNALIIQSAFLGDSLLTLPLARELKSLAPGCRVTVLTLPKSAILFRNAPYVDSVLLDDKRATHSGPLGIWRLARQLASLGFDAALIPHRSLRSALLPWLARIPRRIGFAASSGRALLTDTVPFTWLMHDLERNLALLKPLSPGIRAREDESLYMSGDRTAIAAINDRLRAAGIADEASVVGMHPGSAWPTKRWLPERFSALAARLEKAGFRVVLVGGASDRELCGRIADGGHALDWSGATDLMELKALMGRLKLFVTNDSGPMHLATASGVPTLALFGPTTRELGFFPYGPGHRVVETELECRPCSLHGGKACPRGHFLCMRLLTVDEVWQKAMEMLGAGAPA